MKFVEKHPTIRELKFTLRRIFINPSAIIGFSLLAFFIFVAAFAPVLAPPTEDNMERPYIIPHDGFSPTPKPPSKEHIFGLTSGQYDIYYGVVWGTRTAFQVCLIAEGVSLLIGIILGTLAGFYRGVVDEVIMRIVDVFWAIPMLVLCMAIIVSFGRGINNLIIAMILIEWRVYVRLIRSEILALREQEFVQAAHIMGVSDIKIMLRHILPNSIFSVLIYFSLEMGTVVSTFSFLSFIGLGAPTGYADWGQMVSMARNYIIGPPDNPLLYWYTLVFPATCIVLFVLAFNLIGDALRDAFDPKLRRR